MTTKIPKEKLDGFSFDEIPFEEITPTMNRIRIETTATVQDLTQPQLVIKKLHFKCNYCTMPSKRQSILSFPYKLPKPPKRCVSCGHYDHMEVDTKNSQYIQSQILTLTNDDTTNTIQAIIEDDTVPLLELNVHDKIHIKGELVINQRKNRFVQEITILDIEQIHEEMEPLEQVNTDTRNTKGYQEWVTTIQNRDKTCQICGGHKHLEAHHIYSYKDHPELRLDPGNGVLLCTFCHQRFHSYYGKKVTPSDLIRHVHRLHGGGV